MLNPELRDYIEDSLKRMPKEEMVRWGLRAAEMLFEVLDEQARDEGAPVRTGRRKTDIKAK